MIAEMFQYDFMQRAFLAGGMMAFIAPAIGIFLVTKRVSLTADALAHVSLAGVALGLLFGFSPSLGALLLAVAAAFLVETLRLQKKLSGDTALALILSGGLALAVILLALAKGINADLFGYLFGSITALTSSDVFFILALGAGTLVVLWFFWKELFLLALDEQLAKTSGVPVAMLHFLLAFVTALVVVASLRIVGALLVSALMIIPVAAALQARRGFLQTLLLSFIIALAAVFGGLTLSYVLNIPSGATIVLSLLLFFFISLAGTSFLRRLS